MTLLTKGNCSNTQRESNYLKNVPINTLWNEKTAHVVRVYDTPTPDT